MNIFEGSHPEILAAPKVLGGDRFIVQVSDFAGGKATTVVNEHCR